LIEGFRFPLAKSSGCATNNRADKYPNYICPSEEGNFAEIISRVIVVCWPQN